MNTSEITRRDAIRAGGLALAGAAGAVMFGGCAQSQGASASASAESATSDASSVAGDRSNVPADATGADVTSQSSIALTDGSDVQIDEPGVDIRYDVVDSHLHYCDFLEKTDGFAALARAQHMSGVSESVIFGMGIAKQWDEHTDKAPSYYLSNDSRCYYYSATDFLLAEDLLAQPEEIRRRYHPFCCGINDNILSLVKRY